MCQIQPRIPVERVRCTFWLSSYENGYHRGGADSGVSYVLFYCPYVCTIGVFEDAGTERNTRKGAQVSGRWLVDLVERSIDRIGGSGEEMHSLYPAQGVHLFVIEELEYPIKGKSYQGDE